MRFIGLSASSKAESLRRARELALVFSFVFHRAWIVAQWATNVNPRDTAKATKFVFYFLVGTKKPAKWQVKGSVVCLRRL
jgi:hypothetical protein